MLFKREPSFDLWIDYIIFEVSIKDTLKTLNSVVSELEKLDQYPPRVLAAVKKIKAFTELDEQSFRTDNKLYIGYYYDSGYYSSGYNKDGYYSSGYNKDYKKDDSEQLAHIIRVCFSLLFFQFHIVLYVLTCIDT